MTGIEKEIIIELGLLEGRLTVARYTPKNVRGIPISFRICPHGCPPHEWQINSIVAEPHIRDAVYGLAAEPLGRGGYASGFIYGHTPGSFESFFPHHEDIDLKSQPTALLLEVREEDLLYVATSYSRGSEISASRYLVLDAMERDDSKGLEFRNLYPRFKAIPSEKFKKIGSYARNWEDVIQIITT